MPDKIIGADDVNFYHIIGRRFQMVLSAACPSMLMLDNIVTPIHDNVPLDGDYNPIVINNIKSVLLKRGLGYYLTRCNFHNYEHDKDDDLIPNMQLVIDKMFVLGFNYLHEVTLTFGNTKMKFMAFRLSTSPDKGMIFNYLRSRLSLTGPQAIKYIKCGYYSKELYEKMTYMIKGADLKQDDFLPVEYDDDDNEIVYTVEDIDYLMFTTEDGISVVLIEK
jgi:hypothetical protein